MISFLTIALSLLLVIGLFFLIGSLIGMVLVGLRAFTFIEFLIFILFCIIVIAIAIGLKFRHELTLTKVRIIFFLILTEEVITVL